MTPAPISVLIVDDHAVVREGLRTFLALQDGIDVVGEAADGREALTAEARLSPDVILMDLVMPVFDGVQTMRALHERGSRSHVIVLTSFLDDERILPAIRAGAAGYLLKDVEPAELAAAVRGATGARATIDPTVAARLLHQLSDPTAQAGALAPPDLHALTRREREVLCLIAAGRSNKRIAFELEIAEKTVKTHVGHVLAKLGVSDRTQAALVAVRAGLTDGS
jgi:two-component system, NarL family, response regulator LiaR